LLKIPTVIFFLNLEYGYTRCTEPNHIIVIISGLGYSFREFLHKKENR